MAEEFEIGDEITVRILQLNADGDGLVSWMGFIIFIPDTMPGQLVKAKITRISGKIIYAERIEIIDEDENERD